MAQLNLRSDALIETHTVVVGAGSAGCAIAARLSEDPARDVLLVEAGRDWRSAEGSPPLRSMNSWRALADPRCAEFQWRGLRSRRTTLQPAQPHIRGRGVGGSSLINGMAAVRAPSADYDAWAADGCAGWSYAEMLPYLCRMEADADFGNRPYHGDNGPMPVLRLPPEQWGPVDQALADSAVQIGYGWCEDHNAPTGTGVSPYAVAARAGARVTANDAYLEPVRDRPNLSVQGDALVDRVLIAGDRAVGVTMQVGSTAVTARAESVVLCAGAIHSPAILLRSGIGPDGPVARLPVGQGLQDHPIAVLWLEPRPGVVVGLDERQANCCVRYASGVGANGENDMMMVAINQTPAVAADSRSILTGGIGRGTWGGARGGAGAGGPGMLAVWVNRQDSRGTLRLRSRDPDVGPVIEENLLDIESDRVRLRDGVRRALELLDQPAFTDVVAHVSIDLAGTSPSALSSDAEIDRWLMAAVGDAGHICATCRMGPQDDPRAVVDPSGRVIGVHALWVADASVLPSAPRANINLPTIAVAERIADCVAGRAPALSLQTTPNEDKS